jgi:phospholipase A-2-activating protein
MSLVSGSWDATAKIWDLESGECTATLQGHKYATTVTRLSNGQIVTGSQDGVLHLWEAAGTQVRQVQAHSDIIRQIIEVPDVGILTCSNDTEIKLFGFGTLDEYSKFDQLHEKFIFALASLGGTDFVSGGEDNRFKTYIGGKEQDEILLPSTVWNIVIDFSQDKDIIIACGDG